ncbi:MAG: peptidoglycan editing factor PgeF [Cellvibrionales bacterium TMED47]|nr:multi-copper polyphenol oxidoreductase [Porticoccaceae bacterium]RPG82432.1 MAG: peptidoglycan editing factor PgeF [Cellvibrionales bacterium TMED47]|tara:strand:+ start:5739 stop:6509 length:771 start_codon:yes stop_codon:yes gene_type:complete
MNKATFDYLTPEWPAPDNVQAAITLCSRGESCAPYDNFNLATHVGDDPQQVALNRQQLIQQLDLNCPPLWLNQIHGNEVVASFNSGCLPDADGCFSDRVGDCCVVLTADCLPVLLCNQQGTKVAAVHAGWRGLCGGIITNALNQFGANDSVLAYLGPAISPLHFEVGQEVRESFLSKAIDREQEHLLEKAFTQSENDRYLADLYALARVELKQNGVNQIYGGDFCSYGQSEQFYSYRRDKDCGRNASLIWLKPDSQ